MIGDIILWNTIPKEPFLKWISNLEDTLDGDGTGYSPNHVGIIIAEFKDYVTTLENLPKGITQRQIRINVPDIAIMTPITPVDFTDTVEKFKKEIGEPYGWFALFSAGISSLAYYFEKPVGALFGYKVKKRRFFTADKLKICSEVVRNFYADKNIILQPEEQDILSPCDIYFRNKDKLKIVQDFKCYSNL